MKGYESALEKENMLFATEECIMGNRRSIVRENKPLAACWDGIDVSAQKSLFSLLVKH